MDALSIDIVVYVFPFWKSGRKVGIIKWADLESSFFFYLQFRK